MNTQRHTKMRARARAHTHTHTHCPGLAIVGILVAVWYASSIAQDVLEEADRDATEVNAV